MEKEIEFKSTKRGCIITLPLTKTEKLYGFGLQLKSFCQNGLKKTIRTNADPCADSGDSHAPVPLYVSTDGYAVLFDTARYATFHSGSSAEKEIVKTKKRGGAKSNTVELYQPKQPSNKMIVEVPIAKGVDVYIFVGDNMTDAVARYNLYSGGGCMPPMYGLGIFYRGYFHGTHEEIVNMARSIREDEIPCDIFGLEPGWQSRSYSSSYEWDKIRFENPDNFIKDMQNMNFHLNLWEQAFVNGDATFYDDIYDYSGDYLVWEGLVPDFSLEKARKLFGDRHAQLIESGIDGFKLDECDSSDYTGGWSFPNFTSFPSGMDGEQMHNQLGVLFQSLQNEEFQKADRRTWSQVRASHAFASSYPFVLYSDLYDQRDFMRALVNCGFSGLLWTPEIRETETKEGFIRRMQMVILSPQACINAWGLPIVPWHQYDYEKNLKGELLPEQEREYLTSMIRDIANLRMQLIPYLYTAFYKYYTDGIPAFRALVMDYPKDKNVFDIDDQIMIGDSILAAPVMAGESNKRDIYLPEGNWYDFNTGVLISGGKWLRDVDVPLDVIPIYVKEGTILALAKPTQYVNEKETIMLDLNIYGSNSCKTSLYFDDGISYKFENGEFDYFEIAYNGKEVEYPDLSHRFSIGKTQIFR